MMQIANMTSYFATRRLTGENIPTVESLRYLKESGFDHVDLNLCCMAQPGGLFTDDNWERDAHAVREEAEKLGITFVQSHTPFYGGRIIDPARPEYNAFFMKMFMRAAEVLDIVGVPRTVLHPMIAGGAAKEDVAAHRAENERFYTPYLERLGKAGIRGAFENMVAARGFGWQAEDLLEMLDLFKGYDVALCWDIGHGNLCYPDQTWALNKLAGKICAIHVHDNHGVNDEHLLPFLGDIQWEKVMPALRKAGYEGDLVLEVCQNRKMSDDLKVESARFTAQVAQKLVELFYSEG